MPGDQRFVGRGFGGGSGKKLTRRPERRFWLRLSLIYGTPVRELQHRIDAREFVELYAYSLCEGLPGDDWEQTGTLAATLANCHRGKNVRPFRAEDFQPRWQQSAAMSADQAMAMMRAQASYVNGQRVR